MATRSSSIPGEVAVVIPTLDVAALIARLVAEIPRHAAHQIIVADGGSTGGTVGKAKEAAAEVIEAGRGYGRACLRYVEVAQEAEIVVFMDGGGADDPAHNDDLVVSIRADTHDFVIGSRARGVGRARAGRDGLAPGGGRLRGRARYPAPIRNPLHRHVRLPGNPARRTPGARYARADRWLDVEKQMRAARGGGCASSRSPCRAAGETRAPRKVAGCLRGTLWAGTRNLATMARIAAEPAPPLLRAGEVPMSAILTHIPTNGSGGAPEALCLRQGASPILENKDHDAPSVFRPTNMLREARRQKGLAPGTLPAVCVLDPDGDIVRYLRRRGEVQRSTHWACYHTQLWEHGSGAERLGLVGCAVGGSFAVLVAEQLFASGCELLISIASAGQIAGVGPPPYAILIERALRDEGTSYHYLPPSTHVNADPILVDMADQAFANAGCRVRRGTTWTTDAPFRETSEAIEAHRRDGVLAVEMEAASLYAFAAATHRPVLCLAHVTNQLGCVEGDFEKGENEGACSALGLISAFSRVWIERQGSRAGR